MTLGPKEGPARINGTQPSTAVLALDLVRSRVATLDDDRPPAPDIAAITELLVTSQLENACGVVVK